MGEPGQRLLTGTAKVESLDRDDAFSI